MRTTIRSLPRYRREYRMSEEQQLMIAEAIKQHKKIYPCSHKKDLSECFTKYGDKLLFWFNTEDLTTHVIYNEVSR